MKYLYVGASAEADRGALAEIGAFLSGQLALPLRAIELPSLEFAFEARRHQYGSIPVLEMVQRLCPHDAIKLLAVTELDLFIPVLTFVFGQAQLGGRTAVISLARLRQEFYGLEPDRQVLLGRAFKEALHEAGHTFGLVHCSDPGCAMALSTRVQQIDRKRAEFCPACRRQLGVIA
jgi:archaemetzincin